MSAPSRVQEPARRAGLGINLAEITYWTTEHPFTNLALHASRWRTQPRGKPFTWDVPLPPMTDDNYPKAVPQGSGMESFLLGTSARGHLPKELVVLYDGKGRLQYTFGAHLKQRGAGRDIITDLGGERGAIAVQIVETDPADPLRNIRLHEPNVPTNPPTFRQAFLDRWAGMSVLRFMDWMQTNNSKVRRWEQRPPKASFTQAEGGVALEYMIGLSNVQKAAPWFCIPHLADDEYVRHFAEQVKQELDPSLPVYVEYSNEVWNGIFEQSRHAARMGTQLGLSSNEFEAQLRYYSQRTTEVLKIWEQVFADQKSRIIGVYAAQAANPWTSSTVLEWGEARRYADVLAVAPYFGNALGDPKRQGQVVGLSVDQVLQTLAREVEMENKKMIESQAAVARAMGVRLVAYEGGQHLAGYAGSENNPKLEQLFLSANRHPRMKDIYLSHLNHWKAAGGDLFVLYNSMGVYGKWGSWGLLETEQQDPSTAPKWEAVQQFMRDNALAQGQHGE
ncbi:hypothetical protein GR328_20180 [Microvirga makkahensis]|uniref:Cellulose-binding protein n=1 Tax=Microvirga makkahensis TaxID=1128670 RepID=A0A7X3MUY2_9HYPH|nr:hypothetical protein [Microvirga makkahensis]